MTGGGRGGAELLKGALVTTQLLHPPANSDIRSITTAPGERRSRNAEHAVAIHRRTRWGDGVVHWSAEGCAGGGQQVGLGAEEKCGPITFFWGGWHKALVLVCWRGLVASRHCVWVLLGGGHPPGGGSDARGHSGPGSACPAGLPHLAPWPLCQRYGCGRQRDGLLATHPIGSKRRAMPPGTPFQRIPAPRGGPSGGGGAPAHWIRMMRGSTTRRWPKLSRFGIVRPPAPGPEYQLHNFVLQNPLKIPQDQGCIGRGVTPPPGPPAYAQPLSP